MGVLALWKTLISACRAIRLIHAASPHPGAKSTQQALHFLVEFEMPHHHPPEQKKCIQLVMEFSLNLTSASEKTSPDRPKAFQRKVAACWAWLTWLRWILCLMKVTLDRILSKRKWKLGEFMLLKRFFRIMDVYICQQILISTLLQGRWKIPGTQYVCRSARNMSCPLNFMRHALTLLKRRNFAKGQKGLCFLES